MNRIIYLMLMIISIFTVPLFSFSIISYTTTFYLQNNYSMFSVHQHEIRLTIASSLSISRRFQPTNTVKYMPFIT